MAERQCEVPSEEFDPVWQGHSHAVVMQRNLPPVRPGDTLWLKRFGARTNLRSFPSVHVLVTHVTHYNDDISVIHFQHMHRGGRLCCKVARQDERVEATPGEALECRPLHLVWDESSET